MAQQLPTYPRVVQAQVVLVEVAGRGQLYCLQTQTKMYWPFKTIRDAIHGKVKACVELRLARPATANGPAQYASVEPFQYAALKIIYKSRIGVAPGQSIRQANVTGSLEDPVTEAALQQHISDPGHEAVLRLLECAEDRDNMYLLLEYADGGDLFDHVANAGGLNETDARKFFLQLAMGLRYMFSRGLVHRDMSLANAMLAGGVAKIIDFGQASAIPPDGMVSGRRGKPYYMPPEMFRGERYSATGADMWAMGVMLFIMLVGSPPWELANQSDQRFTLVVVNGNLEDQLRRWDVTHISPEGIDLLKRMFRHNPAERPTMEQMLQHAWFNPVRHLIPAAPAAAGGPAAAAAAAPPALAFGDLQPAQQQQVRAFVAEALRHYGRPDDPRLVQDLVNKFQWTADAARQALQLITGAAPDRAADLAALGALGAAAVVDEKSGGGAAAGAYQPSAMARAILQALDSLPAEQQVFAQGFQQFVAKLPPEVQPLKQALLVLQQAMPANQASLRKLVHHLISCLEENRTFYEKWLRSREAEITQGQLQAEIFNGLDVRGAVTVAQRAAVLAQWVLWLAQSAQAKARG